MASCITSMWSGSVCPQARLTVTQSSSTATTATLAWELEYVTHGYEANTNGNGRAWSVTIDGATVKSGTTDIDGKSTYTVASGTKTVTKTTARSVSFSVSFEFDITWSNVYGDTKTASGSISIGAATYTISYNANGGSGAPSSQTKTHGTSLTLSSTKPTRSGYAFQGWGTSTTDTTVDYAAGASYTANAGDTLYAIWKKTITLSYGANNGSGAPSNQTASVYNATTSYKFTISSTKPTRTGYTFLGWSTSSTATTASYSSGGTITLSSSDTLYAVWRENVLTVIYYGNQADYCTFKGEVISIDSTVNNSEILVDGTAVSSKYHYNTAATSGLADVQNKSYLYLSRKGYSATGEWNTTSDGSGKAVDQKTTFDTGKALATALGVETSYGNGDISIYVYAQWQENSITVNYYSNFATAAFDDALNEVGTDKNVLIKQGVFYYGGRSSYNTYGLANYSNETGSVYMTRTRYTGTGYWCTTTAEDIDLDKDAVTIESGLLSYGGGVAINENKTFDSGQTLAEYFGLSLEEGNAEINLYAHWILLASSITVYDQDGNAHRGLLHIYLPSYHFVTSDGNILFDSDGNKLVTGDGVLHFGIITIYDKDGNAHVVV